MRWIGKCESCGEWNTLVEEKTSSAVGGSEGSIIKPQNINEIKSRKLRRIKSNLLEFDRVVGGGIVPGSVILLGGDPGIGKSTIVLQILDMVDCGNVLYASGEESAEQVKMRADRLSALSGNIKFLGENNIDDIIATANDLDPGLIVVDSIQTVYSADADSSRGSVVQVRESTIKLISLAKKKNIPIIVIGHVTKGGEVAGPKTLEHLVDTVLYLEGDRSHDFRILRSSKNRFGSTSEIGVFKMMSGGFSEIKNPSEMFLKERRDDVPGSCVAALLEGSRSFLIEIQALTSVTNFGYPKRTASGFDLNKLQLIVAVLSKRVGLKLENQDIYINAAGGMKIKEPGADLACALALASAYSGKVVDEKVVAIGEVGLSGEVRSIAQIDKRVAEAQALGFGKIVVPNVKTENKTDKGQIIKVKTVNEAIGKVLIK